MVFIASRFVSRGRGGTSGPEVQKGKNNLGNTLFRTFGGQWYLGAPMQRGASSDSSGLERRPWRALAGAGTPPAVRFVPSLETTGIASCSHRCLWRCRRHPSRGIPRDRDLILEQLCRGLHPRRRRWAAVRTAGATWLGVRADPPSRKSASGGSPARCGIHV